MFWKNGALFFPKSHFHTLDFQVVSVSSFLLFSAPMCVFVETINQVHWRFNHPIWLKQIVWNKCMGNLNNSIWKPIEAHHCMIVANHFAVYLNGHINHGNKILATFHETRVGEWCLQKSWYVPCSKGSLLQRFVIKNHFSTFYTSLKRLCEMMVSSHKSTHQGDFKNFLYGFSVSQFSNAIVDTKTNEPRKKLSYFPWY